MYLELILWSKFAMEGDELVLTLSVAMGLVCTDGIVLGVERLLHSKLLVKG